LISVESSSSERVLPRHTMSAPHIVADVLAALGALAPSSSLLVADTDPRRSSSPSLRITNTADNGSVDNTANNNDKPTPTSDTREVEDGHRSPSITVDDRRERIVSMTTTRSGRRVITRTETGRTMTQPVFFTPGGVVATETVPIYEAEAAVSMRSIKRKGKKRSGRK
jgi:hypothetical protein